MISQRWCFVVTNYEDGRNCNVNLSSFISPVDNVDFVVGRCHDVVARLEQRRIGRVRVKSGFPTFSYHAHPMVGGQHEISNLIVLVGTYNGHRLWHQALIRIVRVKIDA